MIGCKSEIDLEDRTAPLLPNMGEFSYSVTTNSELAQKYFNQGLVLTYGFNHMEAFRSFEEATKIDSNCAMAYWGMAIVLGPNINAPMETSDVITAYEAIQKAIKFALSVPLIIASNFFFSSQNISPFRIQKRVKESAKYLAWS